MSSEFEFTEALRLFARIVGVTLEHWPGSERFVVTFRDRPSGPSMEILPDVTAVRDTGGMDLYLRQKIEEFVETADERHQQTL